MENIDGGEGCDTLDLSAYTTGVTIDLLDPVANKGATVLGDSFVGIEAILGTTRADMMRGDAGDNRLVGNVRG